MSGAGSMAWLDAPLVPLAWCWRITRRDGVTIGLTTHDAPLLLGGLVHGPAPGIRPSAIRQRRGTDGDSVEIEGALNAAAISDADLASGRWDGAAVRLTVADWSAPDARQVVVAHGTLGAVDSDGRTFTAELSARDPALDGPIVPETSAECRADFGDARCRVPLAAHRARAAITAIAGRQVSIAGADERFAYGQLRWLDGPNRGLIAAVTGGADGVLTLALPAGVAAHTGPVELTEGCDRRAATCAARFANIANFRGEPHLPGIDLLTRYPGG